MPYYFIMNMLKYLREQAGISQNQLAMWSGVSSSMIRKLETGKRDINKVSLETIFKFAVIFQVPLEYFVEINRIQLKSAYKEYYSEVMQNLYQCYDVNNRPYYVEYDEKTDPYEVNAERTSKKMEKWNE